MSILPQPPECWHYRHVALHSAPMWYWGLNLVLGRQASDTPTACMYMYTWYLCRSEENIGSLGTGVTGVC